MARQGRPTPRRGRPRRGAGGQPDNDLRSDAMHDDDVPGADEDWHGEPDWTQAAFAAGDPAPRRRQRNNSRVHTPAWQRIDRYREDKWLRERIKEVYDD